MTHIRIIGVCLSIFSGITLLGMLNGLESKASLKCLRSKKTNRTEHDRQNGQIKCHARTRKTGNVSFCGVDLNTEFNQP
jgi:hypothetical protein